MSLSVSCAYVIEAPFWKYYHSICYFFSYFFGIIELLLAIQISLNLNKILQIYINIQIYIYI